MTALLPGSGGLCCLIDYDTLPGFVFNGINLPIIMIYKKLTIDGKMFTQKCW